MRILFAVCAFIICAFVHSPALAQDGNPLALDPEHQDIAEVARWTTAGLNVAMDLKDVFRKGHSDAGFWKRLANFGCRVGGAGSAAYGLQRLIDAPRPNGQPYGSPSMHQAISQATTGGKGPRLAFSWGMNIGTAFGSMGANQHTGRQATEGAGVGLAAQQACDYFIKVEE